MSILSQLRALDWDRQHVQVRFETLSTGAMVYVKQFKQQATDGSGMPFAEYWPERENSLLTRLQDASAKHAVQVETVSRAENIIRTYDAGVSLSNLLRFPVTFAQEPTNSTHPFFSTTEFLKLLRGIIVALDEIHRVNIIHADLNAGNICVKVIEDETGQYCHIDYSRIQLIDFAFSLSRELPLKHILPIDTNKATYMAPLYLKALARDVQAARDRNWQGGCKNVEREMHPYMDFFSLGVLAQDLYDRGVRPSNGIRASELEKIVTDLSRFFGDGKPGLPDRFLMLFRGRPEERILSRIDKLLARAGDTGMESGKFQLAPGVVQATGEQGQNTPSIAGRTPIKTKITPPIAGRVQDIPLEPIKRPRAGARPTKKNRITGGGVILALLIVGGAWVAYQSGATHVQLPEEPPAKQTEPDTPPAEKQPEAPSVESLRRTLEAGAAWPGEFAELLRQHGQNQVLAGALVQVYGKVLDGEDKSNIARPSQRQAWKILASLSALEGGGQFTLLAGQTLDQYRNATEQLSQELRGIFRNPTLQGKEKRWLDYEWRLNLQADMGDTRSSLLLGVINAAQGKTVHAFRRLLEAAGSQNMTVQKAGRESLANFLETVVQSKEKQAVREMVSELRERVGKGDDPNWQMWLQRMNEVLDEK